MQATIAVPARVAYPYILPYWRTKKAEEGDQGLVLGTADDKIKKHISAEVSVIPRRHSQKETTVSFALLLLIF